MLPLPLSPCWARLPALLPSPAAGKSSADIIAWRASMAPTTIIPCLLSLLRHMVSMSLIPKVVATGLFSAYSATNQGHTHPKIVKALVDQASKLALCSQAFYSDTFGSYAKYITEYFGFDMVLPMNTGAEAVETAFAVPQMGLPQKGSQPTRPSSSHVPTTSMAAQSPSSPWDRINYNDADALEAALKAHALLRSANNTMFFIDEIQTKCSLAGLLAIDHEEGVKPDILILAAAPLAECTPFPPFWPTKKLCFCIKPGEHGSTCGGNPLGCAVAVAALEVIKEEKLERADRLGTLFRDQLNALNTPLISLVRGRGLLNAIVIDETKSDKSGMARLPDAQALWSSCQAHPLQHYPSCTSMCALLRIKSCRPFPLYRGCS
ncbi:hypothetical protein BSLG_003675 [Batrachochytrium salamandrivorans]|nr:hypothetical protein BSLG_003675 [Batrachochytrium salamandrivorans]